MKTIYTFVLSIFALAALNSCSTYKSSTTPDDVYYSQGKVKGDETTTNNSDYYSTPNDNYVRMRVQDPDRWSYFDDYGYDYYAGGYGYSPYYSGMSFSMGFGYGYPYYGPYYGGFGYYSPLTYWNSYYAWNNFYNPYYNHVVVINGKNNATPGYTTRVSNFNPSAYQGRYYNTRPSMTRLNTFNNYSQNTNTTNSNYYRSGNSSNSNYRPSYSQPTHTSSSSFGGGGGSSFGGGGSRGGGFSRPSR